ncbi:hypothetical protein [Mycolicibacterium aichiense]|uniref:Cellulose biosynthesis cyclic di-GMP-binding regulatory protein BcsB n=1 Tax=Mycolicibacterium aichiense TaxID=1799 RepID=A0AAD1HR72_9MYCO|nr:hypothetical protein [Mycolicibacterium aichiense]MCV7017344.1 hypothetical protein [Mycolicibacterium aichiense]BBX10222.1 hypothetical protein MAIC_50250 [Mycolicibacterium aichiense]STZ26115.1 Uncharacterised protein [Mycolicibacterium aichiense]
MNRFTAKRAVTWAILLVLSATLFGSSAGVAYAAPGDTADPPAAVEANVLSWPALGLQSTVELYGRARTPVTVPLPAGMTASRLRGMIGMPENVTAGYLEIDDGDGKFLASVDLSAAATAQAATPFDVDISAARVQGSSIDLSFVIRVRDTVDRACAPLQRLTISDLTTEFTGTNPPVTTIASFFPSVLGRVTIYAASDANSAEQQAVLTLVSTLARIYAPRPLPITVVSQPRGAQPPPALGMDRAVVVETGEPGLSVENPGAPDAYLRISGDGDQLSAQVSLLTTELQPLAQVAAARVTQAGSDTVQRGDTLTFGELKVSGQATFFETSTFEVGSDRASLGPRFDGVQVHLLADYTPVHQGDASTVMIRSNNVIVYRGTLDGTGRLDTTFNLDSRILDQRYINLQFTLTDTPAQDCSPLVAPMTFQIDPRSTLTMHRGGAPLGGFTAFPSEFSPKFVVALDGSSPNQLSYAADIVAVVSRITKTPLTPQVVSLQSAVDGNSGALIVANSGAIKQTALNPPIGGEGPMVKFGLPTELNVNMEGGLGSIQAFADPQRNRSVILVTTTGDWKLVDPLFSYIAASDRNWLGLTGDVLAAGEAGTPTNVAIRTTSDSLAPTQTSGSSGGWLKYGLIGGGVLAVIAVLAVILALRRPKPADVDE